MLFGITISGIVAAGAACICTLNMLLDTISVVQVSSKAFFSVIFNDSNISSSASILVAFCLVLFVLSV